MSATWGNSAKIYSLGVLPPVTQSRLPTHQDARGTRRTALFRSARALDIVRTVIRGDSRPGASSLLVDLFMVGRMPLDRLIARSVLLTSTAPPLTPPRALR